MKNVVFVSITVLFLFFVACNDHEVDPNMSINDKLSTIDVKLQELTDLQNEIKTKLEIQRELIEHQNLMFQKLRKEHEILKANWGNLYQMYLEEKMLEPLEENNLERKDDFRTFDKTKRLHW